MIPAEKPANPSADPDYRAARMELLRALELSPSLDGPLICIPDAFEAEQSVQRLLPFLDKILWREVRVIVGVREENQDLYDVEHYVRKYPTRCTIVRRPSDKQCEEYIRLCDLAIFPGAKEGLPPKYLHTALTLDTPCVVYASLIARQDVDRFRRSNGHRSTGEPKPPVYFFYTNTRQGLWDAVNAALGKLEID